MSIIRCALRETSISDPVVSFTIESDQFECEELTAAIMDGSSDSVLEELALKLIRDAPTIRPLRLNPVVYDRKNVTSEKIINVLGIDFCLPLEACNEMAGMTIDATPDHKSLVLISADGLIVLPPKIARYQE